MTRFVYQYLICISIVELLKYEDKVYGILISYIFTKMVHNRQTLVFYKVNVGENMKNRLNKHTNMLTLY